VIRDDVLDHIVEQALRQETGARGLASTLTRHLEEVAFETFGGEKGGVVTVGMIDGVIDVTVNH
jgi:ATP-dependent protease Clp ATPase subunit